MSRKGNRGQQPPQQNRKPLATARPAMYIEVSVAGIDGGQIYPVHVARELHRELGLAIAAVDAPNELVQGSEQAGNGSQQPSLGPIPDDQDQTASDDAQAAADADAHPDA
jgi:hypothetical protein